MELREVLRALRVSWWLPVAGLLIGSVAALVASLSMPPVYTAETQLFVSATESGSTSDVLIGSQFSQQRVASYAELLTGEELAGRVIDQLDLPVTPAHLADRVRAAVVPDTVLLDVSVTDPSPQTARDIAREIGEEFGRMVRELETPAGTETAPVKVTVVDQPELPVDPSGPQPVRNTALGALAGLSLGAAAAVARAALDRSVRDPEEAATLTGAPVVGTVLRDDALVQQHVIERSTQSRTAEDYRQLRTNLQFLSVDTPPRTIVITSALPSEGKTTAVVNLGLAVAEAGMSVTIVEADLRRPKVTRYLGLVGDVGLTNILAGTADLEDVVQRYGDGNLSVIAAGPTPPNPGELLSSSRMIALLEELRGRNDFVLVDAPPLLPVADTSGLSVLVDGVLLSVRYGSTSREQLRQAASTLSQVGARLLGLILNIVPPKAGFASARGYGYDYAHDSGGDRST